MNEIAVTRLIELARCIPRDDLILSEELFRPERSTQEVLKRLDENSTRHVAFSEIASELRKDAKSFDHKVLVLRTAILTRSRYAVHAPRAVCTAPGANVYGMEDTLSETLRLIGTANYAIYILNYWMTSGSKDLIDALMDRLEVVPSLKIVLIGDSKKNFLEPFERMWKRKVLKPTVFIYRAGMQPETEDRSKMHAKTLIVDESKMLITSANLTWLAMSENIEVGISIEAPKAVQKISHMINSLIHETKLFERIY